VEGKIGAMSDFVRTPITYPDVDVPVVSVKSSSGPDMRYHQHTEPDWEFCYVQTGEACFRVNGEDCQLYPGNVLTINPNETHACVSRRGTRFALIIRGTFLKALPLHLQCDSSPGLEIQGTQIPKVISVFPSQQPTMEFILNRLHQESFQNNSTKKPMCIALLTQFFLELSRVSHSAAKAMTQPTSILARSAIQRFTQEVRANPCRNWTLDDMVRRSGYSATQLTLLFKQVVGAPPIRWLQEERIRTARMLLENSEKPVVDIAAEAGFGSRSQFHRTFRASVGLTPNQYRRLLRHEHEP